MNNLAIIVNKKAHNSSSLDEYLNVFKQHKIEFQLFEAEPQKLDEIIAQCKKEFSILLIGGGDGTIRSAAQLCASTDIILGILPLGTMNHFANELDLPNEPEALAQAILHNKTVKIDLAEVNGYIFINNASIGVYPAFVKKRDHYDKFYNKWISYIPGLIETLRSHDIFSLTFNVSQEKITEKTCFFMVSNNVYSYRFPFALERESFEKGLLGIYVYKHKKLHLIKLISAFMTGKKSFEINESKSVVNVAIKDRKKIPISLDGETMTLETPLKFNSLPHSLTLIKNSL